MIKKAMTLAEEKIMIGLAKKELENIFNIFCKAKNIKGVELVLVGEATWSKYLRKETVNGCYDPNNKKIIVKVKSSRVNTITTLMHELTHAYQDVYHKDMLNYGRTQKARYSSEYGYDAYYYSVHEQHARICGSDLAGVIRRNNKSDLHLLSAFRKYSMEDAFNRINTEAYAI